MDQTAIAYKALGAAWDQIPALMLDGRISTREAERIKAELDRVADAIAPDVITGAKNQCCGSRQPQLQG